MMFVTAGLLGGVGAAAGALGWQVRRRNLDRWLLPYALQAQRRRAPRSDEEIHVLLCVADHYEPKHQGALPAVARRRVQRWVDEYPKRFDGFRDSDGQPPRHTFFFPVEEYEPEYLDLLGELCGAGFGEVEIHLHHDRDTEAGLRETLESFRDVLAERHSLLSRHRETGELAYGFIHGNWALNNSRPDGRWCGVNNEIDVLRTTGCYADFTLPSAPSPTQTSTINSIYYARGDAARPKGHDRGIAACRGVPPADALLLVQGPLMLNWSSRKWGLLPRLENGCVQASQPPSLERLALWLKARVQVPARPDWFFVKLHTHGACEPDADALLGEPMVRFHKALADHAAEQPHFRYHYVTAREMVNLVRAAEAGWQGNVAGARDYQLTWNGGCPAACGVAEQEGR